MLTRQRPTIVKIKDYKSPPAPHALKDPTLGMGFGMNDLLNKIILFIK
jgi:hypothetical protein